MLLETTRFGGIEVAPDSIITFSQPIIGFQKFRRFVLLPGPTDHNVKWLQSVDSGELAFIIMDPASVIPDYAITLSAHELTELAVSSVSELEVYTLVVVPEDRSQIRTNLRAPIVINPVQRLAKQTILEMSPYPIQFFLAQAQRRSERPREVSNARADA